MPNISKEDREVAASYEKAKPVQTGSLHERMKHVVQLIDAIDYNQVDKLVPGLRIAIYDLEREVSYHRPAKPPFGSRADLADPVNKFARRP